MLVDSARDKVFDLIIGYDPNPAPRYELTHAIWAWWGAYKSWEEQDTFLAAFQEKRLCITQRPLSCNYEMSAKRAPGHLAPKIDYPGVKYAVGVDSLGTRANPSNFTGVNLQGIKNKYALGLFDLSASLLNPEYTTIKGQLRWSLTGEKKDWRVIFVALPGEDDVLLYNLFKVYAQSTKDMVLQGLVKFIRHRMSRPKLAEGKDMGAGPYDISKPGAPAKFKYGWQSNQGALAEKTKQRALTAAIEYQSILKDSKPIKARPDSVKAVTSNEVTIALRQHAGRRFPIITEYDEAKDQFRFEGPSEFFPAGFIPDAWKTTRETRSV